MWVHLLIICMDKKSSKRKSRKFSHLPVQLAELEDWETLYLMFYISENAKWTTEECTLVLGQKFNHYIGNC